MNWLTFRNEFLPFWCIDVNQIYAAYPDFDRNNLVRWKKNGLLLGLRKGLYVFPECRARNGATDYLASRIYRPSYVSLHTALSFYGLIPEAIVQTTSVTSLKTASFQTPFGIFSYKSVREDLMFGYELREIGEGLHAPFATPEKALVDLLYLYPAYNTESEILDLRLDEDILHTRINADRLMAFVDRTESKALARRFGILRKAYAL